MRRPFRLPFLLVTTTFVLAGETPYQKPPKEVLDVLNAPPTPIVSVSPWHDYAILMQPVRYPPIAEVAQPMLRLAGVRIDSNTNGMHLAPNYSSYTIRRLSETPAGGAGAADDTTKGLLNNNLYNQIERWKMSQPRGRSV